MDIQTITNSFSVCDCLDNIIKYSNKSIVFYRDNLVYKQYPLKELNWVNEVLIVNYINTSLKLQNLDKNIIQFVKCEIINDFVINALKNEICTNKKEKVLRITMNKYDTTIDKLSDFNDYEIFLILYKLISAMLYCISKDILHRDIKENNIFVNYSDTGNCRTLTDVVLADFNISSVNYYVHIAQTSEINTVSHRSPEICKSLKFSTNIKYGEKTDVWSICIVLSFLITNHSFYGFLSDSYLHINPDIICNVDNIIIVMKHFLKLFANTKLKDIKLYKKIIFMGIQHYSTRNTFQEIFDILRDYNIKNKKYDLKFSKINQIIAPAIINSRILVKNTENIRYLHRKLQIHDSVLMIFYKLIMKTENNIDSEMLSSEVFLLTIYILSLFVSYDNHEKLKYYVTRYNKINKIVLLLKKKCKIYKSITVDEVYNEIYKILPIMNFDILK
jgi:serine/threonine protein kinase